MEFTNGQSEETTTVLEQQPQSPSQPEQKFQPLSLDVVLEGDKPEAGAEGTPATTEATPPAATATTTTQEVAGPTYEELVAQVETLKSTPPQKEYIVPETLTEYYNNPDNFKPIVEAQAMSDLDVWKNKVLAENPWATTEEHQLNLIKRDFPDFDPMIPENYGMEPTDYARFKYGTDSHRTNLVKSAQEKFNEGASTIRSQSIPQGPTPEQIEAQNAEFAAKVESYVDEAISKFDLSSLPTVEGIKVNPVDMAKVREDVLAGRGPFIMDKQGMFWPDAQGAARLRYLESVVEQLPATLAELKRTDPQLAAEAIKESLRNPVPATSSPAPATQAAQTSRQQPDSLQITSARNNT